jgi:hypothetical protein
MKKKVSEKQLAANRANALKSTGPKTKAGKATACRNATKHGLRAQDFVVSTPWYSEDPTEFAELAQGLIDHYQPVGMIEEFLVARITTTMWRIRRACMAETKGMSAAVEEAAEHREFGPPANLFRIMTLPPETRQKMAEDGGVVNPFDVHSKVNIGTILRYETTSERQLFKAQEELDRLQSARKRKQPTPPDG